MARNPSIEAVTRRLAECPADFHAPPATAIGGGSVVVEAVVHDLLIDLGASEPMARAWRTSTDSKTTEQAVRNQLSLTLIAAWLLHDPFFVGMEGCAPLALKFLMEEVPEAAALIRAEKFVNDADRREELARLCLRRLGLVPDGETPAQAQDRLTTLSSVERARVLKASEAAEKRAREIREAMAKKAAEEAAASYGRE
jgi:hypothetical protein